MARKSSTTAEVKEPPQVQPRRVAVTEATTPRPVKHNRTATTASEPPRHKTVFSDWASI